LPLIGNSNSEKGFVHRRRLYLGRRALRFDTTLRFRTSAHEGTGPRAESPAGPALRKHVPFNYGTIFGVIDRGISAGQRPRRSKKAGISPKKPWEVNAIHFGHHGLDVAFCSRDGQRTSLLSHSVSPFPEPLRRLHQFGNSQVSRFGHANNFMASLQNVAGPSRGSQLFGGSARRTSGVISAAIPGEGGASGSVEQGFPGEKLPISMSSFDSFAGEEGSSHRGGFRYSISAEFLSRGTEFAPSHYYRPLPDLFGTLTGLRRFSHPYLRRFGRGPQTPIRADGRFPSPATRRNFEAGVFAPPPLENDSSTALNSFTV